MTWHMIGHYLQHVREITHKLAEWGFVVFLIGRVVEWIITRTQGAH